MLCGRVEEQLGDEQRVVFEEVDIVSGLEAEILVLLEIVTSLTDFLVGSWDRCFGSE